MAMRLPIIGIDTHLIRMKGRKQIFLPRKDRGRYARRLQHRAKRHQRQGSHPKAEPCGKPASNKFFASISGRITINRINVFIGHAYLHPTANGAWYHNCSHNPLPAHTVHPPNKSASASKESPPCTHSPKCQTSAKEYFPTECKIKGLFRLTLHHRNQMFNQRMCSSCSRMVNITFHNSQYSSVLVKFLHGLVHSAPCSCIIASLSKGPHVPTGYP